MAEPLALTYIGTATTLLEVGGLRLLTDPAFDAPGTSYGVSKSPLGRRVRFTSMQAPALPVSALGRIDAVLLSHDHHGDNLDGSGRAFLPAAGQVVTTSTGARRLRRAGLERVAGLVPGQSVRLRGSGGVEIEVRATPARHGPAWLARLAGEVIGFWLEWQGRSLYVSGDTVWYPALERFTRAAAPEVAVVHLGGARFPITGPLRYSMDGKGLIELLLRWPDTLFVPVHYEGWSHFAQGRPALERVLERRGLGDRLLWLERGVRRELR
jgi:L-ascorbate metabolism protein UlaG (beta-lactamase superfamily)